MKLRFREVFLSLKAAMVDKESEIVLHSPQGRLRLRRLISKEEIDYVFIECLDDSGEQRTFAFSEEALSAMPLEVRAEGSKRQIGFVQNSGQADDASS